MGSKSDEVALFIVFNKNEIQIPTREVEKHQITTISASFCWLDFFADGTLSKKQLNSAIG
jgi:hypothetical protein